MHCRFMQLFATQKTFLSLVFTKTTTLNKHTDFLFSNNYMDSDIYISSTVRTGLIFKSIVQLLTICIQQLNARQSRIKLTPRSKHHHSEKWHKMQIWCESISWCKNIYCLFAIWGVSHPYMHLVVFVYNLKETKIVSNKQ